ncbi:MAG: hypothetical protein NVS9B15_02800 [Acidobacteriaceae bacterium]
MRLFLFCCLLMISGGLQGQYGYARSGVYPSDYHMQTFTGKLLDYEPASHQITLKCDICAEDERFVAVVGDGLISKTGKMMISQHDSGKRNVAAYVRKPAPDDIAPGDLLRAYYNERTAKRDGKKVKYNAVFAMEKLAAATAPEQKNTGP